MFPFCTRVNVLFLPCVKAGARFLKAPETFRARKAIFSSSVSENGEVYTPETSCVKRTSVYINNT